MFLTIAELKTVIYDYQLAEIVEDDTAIVEMAIQAATEEVKSYLRSRYDVEATFATEDGERNPLILEITKDVALWQIIRLSNPDILHERVKDRYDRAIEWLDKVAKGLISPALPIAQDETGEDVSFLKFGSMSRQTYDY
jgi:phage gp36-like protein